MVPANSSLEVTGDMGEAGPRWSVWPGKSPNQLAGCWRHNTQALTVPPCRYQSGTIPKPKPIRYKKTSCVWWATPSIWSLPINSRHCSQPLAFGLCKWRRSCAATKW